MASSLEQMLQPGERVLYRARYVSDERRAFYFVLIAGLLAYLRICGLLPWLSTMHVVALQLLFGAAFVLLMLRDNYEADAIITGRRLIVGRGPRHTGVDELALKDIGAVTLARVAAPDHIRARARGGTRFQLLPGEDARELASALARAANLPEPPVPSAKAKIVHGVMILGFVPLLTAGTVLVARQWLAREEVAWLTWMSEPALALPLGCLGLLVAYYLYTMLALALIRPFFTAEEVWLSTFSARDLSPAERLLRWPLVLWITVIYGRPSLPA